MPIETDILPFFEWLPAGAGIWLMVVLGVTAAALFFGWLVGAVRHGPVAALKMTGRILGGGVVDLLRISPRRVGALTWLAVKESIRRRVVVAFAVFIFLLLFAGWFLDPDNPQPAQLYLDFVLTATSYLVLLLALFLSALSLPGDIKSKTLHTVVTKPVRPSEIVLGRILGFGAIGTVLLVIMCFLSYVFVVRGLSHTHELSDSDFSPVGRAAAGRPSARKGRTSRSRFQPHRHNVIIRSSGAAQVEAQQGHTHELTIRRSDGETTYELGPPKDRLVARVPLYGKIRFKDPRGKEVDKGVNVGDEWMYRSFIQGGTLAAAIWSFDGITEANFPEDQFPAGLPLEMTLEIFRTFKGQTEDPSGIPGILGSLAVRTTTAEIVGLEGALRRARQQRDQHELSKDITDSAEKKRIIEQRQHYQQEMDKIQARLERLRAALPPPVDVKTFEARDFTTDVHHIPRQLRTADGKRIDLFRDLAPEGKLEVWLQCEEPAQYFGVSQADVYFRARYASFPLNLAKGYVGIWLQMMLIIGIGVMYSTFLSGPIALLATLGTMLGGIFRQFMSELGAGKVIGGGPFEALIRMLTQQNVVQPLEPGLRTRAAQMMDDALEYGLSAAAAILPEFGRFSFADYVAYGFDVSTNLLVQCLVRAAAFLVPVFVAGYLFLKTREVAG